VLAPLSLSGCLHRRCRRRGAQRITIESSFLWSRSIWFWWPVALGRYPLTLVFRWSNPSPPMRTGRHRGWRAVWSSPQPHGGAQRYLVLLLGLVTVVFLLADLAGVPSAPTLDLRLSWPREHCLTMPRWLLPGAGTHLTNPNPLLPSALSWCLL